MTTPNVPQKEQFWSDDFDMDLLKVIPETEQLLGQLKDLPLYTYCTSPKNGRLNHPNVWNGYQGPLAFFGFSDPALPDGYSPSGQIVECTFLEALRDCWAHTFIMYVEQRFVFNSFAMNQLFMDLMFHRRGQRDIGAAATKHYDYVRSELELARTRLILIQNALLADRLIVLTPQPEQPKQWDQDALGNMQPRKPF